MIGFGEDGLVPGMGDLLPDLDISHGGNDKGSGTLRLQTGEVLKRVGERGLLLLLEEAQGEDAQEDDLAGEVVGWQAEEGTLLFRGVGVPVYALGVNLRSFLCIVSHEKLLL